jgi:chemotaxis protein MotB
MAKHRPKKQHAEEHGEGWIVSYSDLMTLLMGFFVVLCAMSGPKDAKTDPEFADLIAAIRKAFKYVPPADSKDPIDLKLLLAKLKNIKGKSGTSGQKGEAVKNSQGMTGRHDLVTTVRTGSQTTIGGVVPFEAENSGLSELADVTIRIIANQIRGHTNVFVVKGHTSRDEEYKLQNSKRDLAYERATAVMLRLVELGVAREALRVESCRDFEPRKEGAYSEVSRSDNRRAEVIATEALVSEYQGEKTSENIANKMMEQSKEAAVKKVDATAPEKKQNPLPKNEHVEVSD